MFVQPLDKPLNAIRLRILANALFCAGLMFAISTTTLVHAQQPVFRTPEIPGDAHTRPAPRQIKVSDSTKSIPAASNRFGMSPHLTSSPVEHLGVNQRGNTSVFRLPSGRSIINRRQSSSDTPSFSPFGHSNRSNADTVSTSTSIRQDNDEPTGDLLIQFSDLESIEGIESEFFDVSQSDESGHDQSASSSYRQPVGNRTVVTQRYPDGKPKIEREVAQDAEGNFFNDGFWRVKSRSGKIIAQGHYRGGVMQGQWQRQHTSQTSGLFATKPFNLFQSPYLSSATFNNGKLDGMWTLTDAYERKIFEIPYRQNQRHGTATWWFPSMNKMREVTFKNGLLDGKLQEWDEQGKLTRDDEFYVGKKVIRNITFYRPQQKKSEDFFLDAKLQTDGTDNWWDAEPAPLVSTGERVQHGPTAAWYDNGLPKMKGEYDNGQRVGQFAWWHSNGNKQLEGTYTKGQKTGRWTWWHDNGMKAIEGQYENDQPVGRWRWWEPEGKLESEENLSIDESFDILQEDTSQQYSTQKPSIENLGSSDLDASEYDNPDNLETLPEALPAPADSEQNADPNDIFDLNNLENIAPTEAEPRSNSSSDPGFLPENFFSE